MHPAATRHHSDHVAAGLEASNAHAFSRCIYIHGTPEEKRIGRPASYGCIRMKSRDIAALYAQVPLGAIVEIVADKLPKVAKAPRGTVFSVDGPKPEPEKVEVTETSEKPAETTVRKAVKIEEEAHFGRGA